MNEKEQFFALTPVKVLEAVEAGGVPCTGLCYPLNSLENRVYELEREDRSRVIAKFYRPARWSQEAILEEHGILQELKTNEIPVCPPLPFPDGETLKRATGTNIHYALFPKVGGRAPDELSDEQVQQLGRLVARIHNVAATRPAPARPELTADWYGRRSLQTILANRSVPMELERPLKETVDALLTLIEPLFDQIPTHRIHGDCHLGNLLWGNDGAFFLDFDDMLTGPAVQDLWLLIPGRDRETQRQRELFVEAYGTFRKFEHSWLKLIEPLRTLRRLRYCAWITRRWEDPSFPNAFPDYGSRQYWQEFLADMKEQLQIIQEDIGDQQPASGVAKNRGFNVRFIPVIHQDFQRILNVRTTVMEEELNCAGELCHDGQDEAGLHLLAEDDDGRALGVARLQDHTGTSPLKIDRLLVLEQHRKRGVGKAIVGKAEEFARMMGAPGVQALTRVESIPFYGALGFLAITRPYESAGLKVRMVALEWS